MKKFEVEFAKFKKVIIEAETKEEADDIAATMDADETIDWERDFETVIWNDPVEVK